MDEPGRDPDAILARLRTEHPQANSPGASARGRLKIYFGFAAGVGKTYSMLEDARAAAITGVELVLGYVEPHGRPQTETLLLGQELLPTRTVEYRGVTLKEFDLDAALKRKPQLLLVDELAHTNALGSRHAKRWQDVQELLDAGINVWTTLNVQHLESLNDVVAQITGIVVRETLPDAIFDQADEIELVDLPPENLLERLTDGKVYVPDAAQQAMGRFFRKANLIALRELAMRRTADRLNSDVQSARLGQTRTQTWPTRERLLVCIGPSPTTAKVIRAARRMASAFHAQWLAVYAETPRSRPSDVAAQQRVAAHMRLAEQLGAETVALTAEDVAAEIINYARTRNVTKIVIGKTAPSRRLKFWRLSVVDRLLAQSGDIDVYVIRGEAEDQPAPPAAPRPGPGVRPYAITAGILAFTTLVAMGFDALDFADPNLVMAYLLAVVFIAARLGRGPGLAASALSVLLFNYFFTQPLYRFVVHDSQYIVTFIVMFAIAVIVSAMTGRIHDQADLARQRERRTEALYRVSHRLASISGLHQLVAAAQEQLAEIFHAEVVIFLPEGSRVAPVLRRGSGFEDIDSEQAAANWVYERGRMAGLGTDTLPQSKALYLPLAGARGAVGVLAIRPADVDKLLRTDQRQLLEAFVSQIALAIQRDRLAEEAQHILAQAEAEKLRSSLLSSVSHDLRTPLAAIVGASSSMLQSPDLDEATRRELLQTINDESDRLSRLVENLLHMTRLEAGRVRVDKQWQPIEEVVGSALARMPRALGGRAVRTALPADLPLVPLDGVLIEQVLINLLDNAVKYSPPASPIDITARADGDAVTLEVADRGPGFAPGEVEQAFEKFFRGAARTDTRGAGLGLSICRAILQAHGGTVHAANRDGGGAVLAFTLPIEGEPPEGPREEGLGPREKNNPSASLSP